MNFEQTFDYIVIGAGATGCVVTNRLSANSDTSVLVLEAGSSDDNPLIHTRNYFNGFINTWGTDLDWQLETEEQPGLNGRKIGIIQGKVVGGGSSVHAMMYVRGDRLDYDHWNFLGNEGWSYEDVLPYFKKSEDYEGGADEYHGAGGGMKGMKCPDLTPVAYGFLNAAAELGYKSGPDEDLNAADHAAAGIMQFNFTADGKRCSAADGFLTPILDRPNLTVKTKAEVTRVLFEGTRAVGVEYIQDGETHQVKAEREVIVSAGAFLSPKILMLSGIGPADHLQSHGISVVVDLPGVGQNLQDHMRLMVAYKSKTELPLPTTVAEVGLFTRSRSGMQAASPDLQINFSAGIPGFVDVAEFPFEGPHSIFVPILVQPQSRGYVNLRSSNPQDKPVVNPNYLGSETDVKAYIRGVEICREMANTQAFADFNDGEICPGVGGNVEEYIRSHATTIWHPAGSCKMGRDAMAVVDPQLRVYGVEGLRVADASIMPTVSSGNTNAPSVMIGEKAADMILAAKG
jgi:choline dehydrogenase